ncbi:hypothetical protein Taro_004869 [Colocasia esculenta]|uniref:Uncharacterized protein n=1 Tax=Colocasia esculenta TaxID=4460 RepID=A0A843TND7_COLES|nr:hypothetical protein [Colocasia esculenta]
MYNLAGGLSLAEPHWGLYQEIFKFKRKDLEAAWDNEEATTSESSSSEYEKEQDSLGASGTKDAQGIGDCQLFIQLIFEEGVATLLCSTATPPELAYNLGLADNLVACHHLVLL